MRNFFAVLLLGFIIISCQNHKKNASGLVHYIPKGTPVVIKVNDLPLLKSELKNNDFIKEIQNTSFYNSLAGFLNFSGYFNPEDNMLLCFDDIGKQNFEYALITKYKEAIFRTDSLQGKKIDTLEYDGTAMRRITTEKNVFYTAVMEDVLIVSSSQLFTENIIRQKNVKDHTIDDTFYRLYSTSDAKRPAVAFINNNKIGLVSDLLFKNKITASIRDFADWTAMEFSIAPDMLTVTGIALTGASASKTMTLFEGTSPKQNLTATLTPVNATGFISFTFDDYTKFGNNLTAYNNHKNSSINTVKNDTVFEGINEIGIIFGNEGKSVAIRSTMVEALKSTLINDDEALSKFREISIYKCNNATFITERFSPLLTDTPVGFYSFIGDFVLFSNTMASMQNIITNHLNGATLAYKPSYKDFSTELIDNASVLMVGLNPQFKPVLQEALSATHTNDIKTIALKNYPYVAFQVIGDRGFSHITSVIKKPVIKTKENTLIQSLSIVLDADVALPPQFVTNHRTKQKEIIVQDVENTLYLISNTGKVRWKKQLESTIQGRIEQVDLYRNGKLQLAFVTRNKLHIIDRNGNEVTPFPIRFSSTVTQPLAVFDYDKTRNYRFLVCQGKNLVMYNNKGEIVDGFTLSQTKSTILHPPKHFRIGTKDYLVIPEENGTLNILHRTGKTRIPVNRKIDFSENTVYLHNTKFTTTDRAGNLIQVDQQGKISSRSLKLEPDHFIDATNKALVSLSDNSLTIKGKKVTLDFGFYTKPGIFYVNNKMYVTTTDMQTSKVYVYDSNAVLLPNFPVYGMDIIDLSDTNNDKKPEFTVQGDKNAILLYTMN